jgi:8-oxo-dGTP pyrophosphatase MutT (NUDIX family)
MVVANKACPVVLRRAGSTLEVLAFRHPLAGFQLVKGTIESGESPEEAALRELCEESGITSGAAVRSLGLWSSGFQGQVWAFVECEPSRPVAEAWIHEAPDDGGHAFEFFWHPLNLSASPPNWHALFSGALAFIRSAVEPLRQGDPHTRASRHLP